MNKIVSNLLKLRRSFHTTPKRFDEKNVVPNPKATPESPPVDIGKIYMAPNGLDKIILLWGKKYKSRAEIPNLVPGHVYNHARNVVRIKFANVTIAIVILGCIYQVYTGKEEAKLGNTLQKRSLDWHEELKKEHEKELREKAAAALK